MRFTVAITFTNIKKRIIGILLWFFSNRLNIKCHNNSNKMKKKLMFFLKPLQK